MKDNQTLSDLHNAIFDAFDRDDPHLYSFYMTDGSKRSNRFHDCPEFMGGTYTESDKPENSAESTKIKDLNLSIKDKFEYLFDFGDNWLHEIVLEKIEDTEENINYPQILKKNGKSPPQYVSGGDY